MEPGAFHRPIGRTEDPRGLQQQLANRKALNIERLPSVERAVYDGDQTLFIKLKGKDEPLYITFESKKFKNKMLRDPDFSDRVISNILFSYGAFRKKQESDPERKEDYFTIIDSEFSVYHESGIGDFFKGMFGLAKPEEVIDLSEQPHSEKIGIPVDLRKGLEAVEIPTNPTEIYDTLSRVHDYLDKHKKECLLGDEARYLQALLDQVPREYRDHPEFGPKIWEMERHIKDSETGPGHVIPITRRPDGG